ncbi:hypothetical protein Tsp_04905 [Trichinella spiralis]|uniref:hypothetical protein n=1 Tax=Trichinella spiralis TaxID=6334 RepID=UPI0001EFE3A6|nr:hypothetical protein Tsp_04905 [Trichinella spiralis]
MFYTNFITKQSTRNRSYPSLLDSVSCSRSPFPAYSHHPIATLPSHVCVFKLVCRINSYHFYRVFGHGRNTTTTTSKSELYYNIYHGQDGQYNDNVKIWKKSISKLVDTVPRQPTNCYIEKMDCL